MNGPRETLHRGPIGLSPWYAAAIRGDIDRRLPDGYSIEGLARTKAGPFSLRLFHDGRVIEHLTAIYQPTQALRSMIERTWARDVTVTTDAEGYITSIEGNHG